MRSNRVITRALLARFIFVAHSLLAIWQMVEVSEKTSYWSLTVIALTIFLEGVLTVVSCDGQEGTWFCPSVFLYLCSVVPPIWYLQLDLSIWSRNATVKDNKEHKTTIESTLHVGRELWIQIIEQTLLVTLIIGRWMLPKGDITREQLSQILLAYLAIASDIVELFDVFKETVINTVHHLPYLVLIAWTLSLFQFPFVLTTSKARKMRVAITTSNSDEEVKRLQYMASCEAKDRPKWVQIAGDADVWAILLALFLQDIPFLLVRLYLMIEYKVMSYTMIFFTSKNLLVIMLQMYRLAVLVHERYHKAKIEQDAHRLLNHYRQMLDACKDVLHKLKDEGASHVTSMRMGRGKKKGGGVKKQQVASGVVRKKRSDSDAPYASADPGSGGSNSQLIRKPYRRKRTSFQEEEEIIQIELEKVRDDDEDVVFDAGNPVVETTVAQMESDGVYQSNHIYYQPPASPNMIFSPSVSRRKDDEPKASPNTRDEFGSATNTVSLGYSENYADPDHSKLSNAVMDSQSTLNTDENISDK